MVDGLINGLILAWIFKNFLELNTIISEFLEDIVGFKISDGTYYMLFIILYIFLEG